MAEFLDDEQRAAHIAALKRELVFRESVGKPLDAVEAELARLEDVPHKRARKATSTKAATARRRSA